MSQFEGKTALVTGAASGIGRASALAFAKEGAAVAAVDLNEGALCELVDDICARGGRAIAVAADVTSPQDIARTVARASEAFGGIDFAHNNAGVISANCDITDVSIEEFSRVMAVNVFSVFHCLQALIPHMAARGGGAIVNTASVSALTALPGIAPYATSKHAVLGLTRAAALDAIPKKVRVNCVCPGFVETPLTRTFWADHPETRDAILAQYPIGTICQPENIADAVVWLCSDRASYMVGASVVIDGGNTVL